jgi:hypothetical protein
MAWAAGQGSLVGQRTKEPTKTIPLWPPAAAADVENPSTSELKLVHVGKGWEVIFCFGS